MPGHATRRQVIAGVLVPRGVRARTNAGRRRQWPAPNCLQPKSDGPHFGFREKWRRSGTGGAFCSCWSRTGAGVDRGRPWRPTAWRACRSGKTSRSPRSWMALAAAIPVALTSSLQDCWSASSAAMRSRTWRRRYSILSVEVGAALVPASDQEVGCRRGLLHRMELVLGLGAELVERCDVARAGADG